MPDGSATFSKGPMETATAQLETRNPTQLAEAYIPLAKKMAKEMFRALGRRFDLEELESDAYLGLCEAANSFTASHGVSFGFWAAMRIRGAMIDELRKRSPDAVPDDLEGIGAEAVDHREQSPEALASLREEVDLIAEGIQRDRYRHQGANPCSVTKVSKRLGIKTNTASARVAKARRILEEINADKVAKMKEAASCN